MAIPTADGVVFRRSGETLGRLQKVRTDVEKLIATSINVLFTSLVGIIFVRIPYPSAFARFRFVAYFAVASRVSGAPEQAPFNPFPWLWLVLGIAFAALSFILGRRLRSA